MQLRVSSLTAKRAHYPIARYLSYALHLLLVTPLNFHNYPRARITFSKTRSARKYPPSARRRATSWIGKLIDGDSDSGGGSGKSISSILMILRLIKFSNLSSRRGGEEYTEYGPFSFLDAEDEEEEKV